MKSLTLLLVLATSLALTGAANNNNTNWCRKAYKCSKTEAYVLQQPVSYLTYDYKYNTLCSFGDVADVLFGSQVCPTTKDTIFPTRFIFEDLISRQRCDFTLVVSAIFLGDNDDTYWSSLNFKVSYLVWRCRTLGHAKIS